MPYAGVLNFFGRDTLLKTEKSRPLGVVDWLLGRRQAQQTVIRSRKQRGTRQHAPGQGPGQKSPGKGPPERQHCTPAGGEARALHVLSCRVAFGCACTTFLCWGSTVQRLRLGRGLRRPFRPAQVPLPLRPHLRT